MNKHAIVSSGDLLQVIFMLLAIVAVIIIAAWLFRKISRAPSMNRGSIKILAALPLGARERIMLIQVGEQQMLIGASAQHINTLHVFATPVIDADHEQSVPHSIYNQLRKFMPQRKVQ